MFHGCSAWCVTSSIWTQGAGGSLYSWTEEGSSGNHPHVTPQRAPSWASAWSPGWGGHVGGNVEGWDSPSRAMVASPLHSGHTLREVRHIPGGHMACLQARERRRGLPPTPASLVRFIKPQRKSQEIQTDPLPPALAPPIHPLQGCQGDPPNTQI